MSKKKDQHTVPESYLQGFVSDEIPPEHRANPLFEPGVWVSSPDLQRGWSHRHPSNVLTKSYFYNIPGDSPDAPVIEEFLSRVEATFPRVRRELVAGRMPTGEDIGNLALFASTLSMRTEAQLAHWERQFSDLRHLYRQVGGYDPEEPTGDSIADGSPEVLARQLITEPTLARLLLEQGMYVLVNRTEELFVSSDNPVIHQHWHVDEMQRALAGLVRADIPRSERRPVTLLPLDPRHLLISSLFLKTAPRPCGAHDITEAATIVWLNILALVNADELVVSSKPRVSRGDDLALVEGMERWRAAQENGVYLSIYTKRERYWLPIRDLDRTGGRLSFVPLDLEEFHRLVDDGDLDHLEVHQGTDLAGGMRQIMFHSVDASGNGPSVIKHSGGLDFIFGEREA